MKDPVTIDLNTIVTQTDNLLATELNGETVMMSLTQAAYYGLDATAQRIWNLIAEPCQVGDLCETLIAEYAVEREACQQQVCAFLTALNKEGLIRIVSEHP